MYFSAWMATLLYCLVRCSAEEVVLESSPAYVCPSEEVTLNCSVPDTQGLFWIVPDAENNEPLTITILCNNINPNRRGPYQPALVGCEDNRIISTLVFNVSQEINVTCWNGQSLRESIVVSPQGTPPPPVLSLNKTALEGNDNGNSRSGVIQWEIPTEDIAEAEATLSNLVLQFSPSVPECDPKCSLGRDTGPLTAGEVSVTLEVGTRYEVVARAESCGGDLTSQSSDKLVIYLQVPTPVIECMAVPTYDSEGGMELLELNVAWSPLTDCIEISPMVVISLSGYMVNYTTDTQSIEQTVSPSSCGSQCRDTLSGDEVDSVITTVTVQAWNTFGRGEETLCNKYTISETNNVAKVVVEVGDSTADVSLQWLQQQPVYPDLIQVFCRANLSHEEIDLCGETSNPLDKAVLKKLDPNATYYYKVEANGEHPFVVQGYFTTTPLDGGVKDPSSLSTAEGAGIGAGLVGGILLVIVIVGATVCLLWKNFKSRYHQRLIQFEKIFSCNGNHLHIPRGIAVSSTGEIYVSDILDKSQGFPQSSNENEHSFTEDCIQVFNGEGEWLKKLSGNFNCPRGLDINDSYLYVSDCVNSRVAKLLLSKDQSPSLCATPHANKLDLKYPYGLTVVKEIETVFICNEKRHHVVATDLNFEKKYVLGGSGELPGPVDVAYHNGYLYVADNGRRKNIAVFRVGKESKKPCAEFNSTQQKKTFNEVQGICIADNRIYVADAAQHIVIVMDLKRNLVGMIEDEDLYKPTAVTVHNGNVYVTSDANDGRKAAVHVYAPIKNE